MSLSCATMNFEFQKYFFFLFVKKDCAYSSAIAKLKMGPNRKGNDLRGGSSNNPRNK